MTPVSFQCGDWERSVSLKKQKQNENLNVNGFADLKRHVMKRLSGGEYFPAQKTDK